MNRKRGWPISRYFFLVGWLVSTAGYAQRVATVEGIVQDSLQNPLEDVFVLLGNTRQQAVTNADGSFRLQASPSTYDLVLSHLDYTNILRAVDLAANDTLRLVITLQPNTRVLEQVAVVSEFQEEAPEVVHPPPLDSSVVQNAPSPANDSSLVMPSAMGSHEGQLSTIEGTVQDSLQNPLGDVFVLLGDTRQQTMTNADGSFRLRAAPGTYDLLLSYLEYTNILQEVDLTENDTLRLVITLRSDARTLEPVVSTNEPREEAQEVVRDTPPDSPVVRNTLPPVNPARRGQATPPEVVNDKERLSAIEGTVQDSLQNPLEDVFVLLGDTRAATTTDANGAFRLVAPTGAYDLVLSHLEYTNIIQAVTLPKDDTLRLIVTLKPDVRLLREVEVVDTYEGDARAEAGLVRLDPQAAQNIPSPFNDFSRVLATLPGVVSNNELSATYSVRGGNYDENLVYVNNIPIYRPFLIRAGQQEGLSFINPDLVSDVSFSSGGWQAKYGDKLSSSLNVKYKQPERRRASVRVGLLGGSAHLEGATKNATFIVGVRHKSAQYLLNTLEVNGQYLPRFTDAQSYLTVDLDGDPNRKKTELGVLLAYANNRYLVRPASRTTTFGTLQQSFRLFVGYAGQEELTYKTGQVGITLDHRFTDRWRTQWIASGVSTREREYFDQLAAYELCNVDVSQGGNNSNDCAVQVGIGANYAYARNKLEATIFNAENRTTYLLNDYNTLEFGVGLSVERIGDQLNEYRFSDSADFATVNERIDSELSLNTERFTAYVQNTTEPDEQHTLHYGVRFNYWSYNQQWLVSPRVQYAFRPGGTKDLVLRLGGGLYQQPPFYRELRDRNGQLNPDIRAQSSVHAIAGIDRQFQMFDRDFKVLAEVYYKYLYNVIPYDVDNVRIRYFANNNATAYATGIDMRVSGEFIPGAESWFSLGVLRTRENIVGDSDTEGNEVGYIRRPSDQLINLGIFFQDHLPDDPTVRVHLSVLYGSGLPFGPPNNPTYRNFLNGSEYQRVDIGFSKEVFLNRNRKKALFHSLWLGVEILNVLGTDNPISYTWIEAVNRQQYAVPNSLSARFVNAQVILR